MKKVFVHIDFTRVGHLQSVLEEAGIRSFIKNQGASVGMGEIPYFEVWPELWIVDDEDYGRAVRLIAELREASIDPVEAWTCPRCGTRVETGFGECWNCGNERERR